MSFICCGDYNSFKEIYFFVIIDHIIMSNNVFNFITDNFVLSDPCNHSSHNIVYMSISVI